MLCGHGRSSQCTSRGSPAGRRSPNKCGTRGLRPLQHGGRVRCQVSQGQFHSDSRAWLGCSQAGKKQQAGMGGLERRHRRRKGAANQSFAAGSESATRCALSCLTCFVLLQALGICRGARPASKAAAQPTSYVARFSCHVCWYGGWKGQSRRQSPLLCRHTGVPLAAPPSSYVPSHVLLLDQCLARHASRSGMHHCMARRMPESSADGSPPSLLHACCPRARP